MERRVARQPRAASLSDTRDEHCCGEATATAAGERLGNAQLERLGCGRLRAIGRVAAQAVRVGERRRTRADGVSGDERRGQARREREWRSRGEEKKKVEKRSGVGARVSQLERRRAPDGTTICRARGDGERRE